MPGVDWIPGIAQLKAGVQLAAGDSEEAHETRKRWLGTVNNVANGLPVVGHIKGVVHHICGDHEGGNEALYAATRTTYVIGRAAIAALVTGGIGFITAVIAEMFIFDFVSTLITHKPQGSIAVYIKVLYDPSPGNIFDAFFKIHGSKAEKQKILQNFANETVDKYTKSLKSSSGYSNSTKESLLERKNEFEDKEDKNQLKQLINQRVWLHVRMPKEFPYTGAILLNNAFFGLYHSVIRHYDEFADFIPNFQTAFQDPIFDDLRLCLQDIANKTYEAAAKKAAENYEMALRKLGRENYNRFLEVQYSFLDLQLDLYSFIQENVTYANYLGEGVNNYNEVRVFFKVTDKKGNVKVMEVGVSSNNDVRESIFLPEKEFGDGRPIRTIITAFIMSWDDYLKQKVDKKF